jgi:hypothetical protein
MWYSSQPHRRLDHVVELVEAEISRDEQAPPDRRPRHSGQADLQLEDRLLPVQMPHLL